MPQIQNQYPMTPLNILPGIQRDGTALASRYFRTGQHVRFQRGLARKIGGYNQIFGDIFTPNNAPIDPSMNVYDPVPRGTFLVPNSPNFNVYFGDANAVRYFIMNTSQDPTTGPNNVDLVDRTPVNFIRDPNNVWFFDSMFSTTDNGSVLIAFAAPNLDAIDSPTEREVYFGQNYLPGPFTPGIFPNTYQAQPLESTGISTSGGIVVLHPFLFIFGNDGHIRWTQANNPTVIEGDTRASDTKIVAGIAVRGGNSSPAGLFWSLTQLIRCTFTGGPEQFTFDTISDESSILSPKSVIEFDGLYYWVAQDRFCVYNGTMQTIPNDMNINFFFDNLNYTQSQKVWASKIPRFGEIWWFFPFGDATECNHAVIYNVYLQKWYDTASNRSCGLFNQIFNKPIWFGNTLDGNVPYTAPYSAWAHEVGYNRVVNGIANPIDSFIGSCPIALPAYGPSGDFTGLNRWSELYQYEPDMNQVGDVTLTVTTQNYARDSNPIVYPPITIAPNTGRLDILIQGREMTLEWDSNVVDGFYEFGLNLFIYKIGDARE